MIQWLIKTPLIVVTTFSVGCTSNVTSRWGVWGRCACLPGGHGMLPWGMACHPWGGASWGRAHCWNCVPPSTLQQDTSKSNTGLRPELPHSCGVPSSWRVAAEEVKSGRQLFWAVWGRRYGSGTLLAGPTYASCILLSCSLVAGQNAAARCTMSPALDHTAFGSSAPAFGRLNLCVILGFGMLPPKLSSTGADPPTSYATGL